MPLTKGVADGVEQAGEWVVARVPPERVRRWRSHGRLGRRRPGLELMVSSHIGTRRAAPGLRHLGGRRGLCRPKMRWLGVESLILEIEVTGDSDPDVVADCACATEIKERFPLGVQQLTAQALVVL